MRNGNEGGSSSTKSGNGAEYTGEIDNQDPHIAPSNVGSVQQNVMSGMSRFQNLKQGGISGLGKEDNSGTINKDINRDTRTAFMKTKCRTINGLGLDDKMDRDTEIVMELEMVDNMNMEKVGPMCNSSSKNVSDASGQRTTRLSS